MDVEENDVHNEKCCWCKIPENKLFRNSLTTDWTLKTSTVFHTQKRIESSPTVCIGMRDSNSVSAWACMEMALVEFFPAQQRGCLHQSYTYTHRYDFRSSLHRPSLLHIEACFYAIHWCRFRSQHQHLDYCSFHHFLPTLLPHVTVCSLSILFYPVPVDATPARRTSPATFIVYIVVCFYKVFRWWR